MARCGVSWRTVQEAENRPAGLPTERFSAPPSLSRVISPAAPGGVFKERTLRVLRRGNLPPTVSPERKWEECRPTCSLPLRSQVWQGIGCRGPTGGRGSCRTSARPAHMVAAVIVAALQGAS